MRHGNAAVCHHDYQIPQAQLEARVPGDTQDDDLPVEVPSFEQILDRYEPLHFFIIACHPRVCTRAVETMMISRTDRKPSFSIRTEFSVSTLLASAFACGKSVDTGGPAPAGRVGIHCVDGIPTWLRCCSPRRSFNTSRGKSSPPPTSGRPFRVHRSTDKEFVFEKRHWSPHPAIRSIRETQLPHLWWLADKREQHSLGARV